MRQDRQLRRRILCFLHSFEPGGVEGAAFRLCRQWHADGARVVVAIGRGDGAPGVDPALRLVLAPRTRLPVTAAETLWMILWLPFVIRRLRPDVLFCAGNSYAIVAVAMKLLLGRRCPPVVAKISNDLVRHDLPWPARSFYRLWCRVQGQMFDRVVAMSPAMAAEVRWQMGVPGERLTTIASPVLDGPRRAALRQAGERAAASRGPGRRFLAAGRLVAQKDFATLIAGFGRAARPCDTLVILGEGPERQRLERQVAALGLVDRVSLPGHAGDVAPWLARADLLILSSRYEGVPAVVVEAMAAGLPVIATDCCASMGALLGDGAFGRLVPVGDAIALGEAIAAACPLPGPDEAAIRAAAAHGVIESARAYLALIARLGRRAPRSAPRRPLAGQPA